MIPVIKPAARADILRQIGYYGDLDRPDVGVRFLEAVRSSIDRLVPTPLAGFPQNFDHPALHGMRTWPVKGFEDFRIYYMVAGDLLLIVRVLRGRRDIEGIFQDFDETDH